MFTKIWSSQPGLWTRLYLAIKKKMEPTLLLPIGFGTILVNLP
ncbi:MAG: sodium ion-translocating decarboxylase subunit beta, partial [Oscillospiraceae bacterium]|nr:sodium ion-translocating decarboxylase subunit beta [Oscillospiraceae bacterium]